MQLALETENPGRHLQYTVVHSSHAGHQKLQLQQRVQTCACCFCISSQAPLTAAYAPHLQLLALLVTHCYMVCNKIACMIQDRAWL